MADRQQRYTDFKDPFDLLTDLHSTRLRMIYQNEFARGDRTDIEMGTRAYPNSGVGKVNAPTYNLNVSAPSSMFQAREGSGTVMPPPTQIDYQRNYGNTRLDRDEVSRLGTVAGPMSNVIGKLTSDISSTRARKREERRADTERAYRNAWDPSLNYNLAYENATQRAQQVQNMEPQVTRLGELATEMADIESQREAVSNRLAMTKGIQEFRDTQRQAQGQSEIERRKGIGQRISENVAPQVTETLPKSGLTPYKMLNPNPFDPENIGAQLENIMSMKSPAPAQGTGLSPINVDWAKSNIPPGQTSPFPNINKTQNTTALGGSKPSTPPPPGYNPSQGTSPGPTPMHRRRRR